MMRIAMIWNLWKRVQQPVAAASLALLLAAGPAFAQQAPIQTPPQPPAGSQTTTTPTTSTTVPPAQTGTAATAGSLRLDAGIEEGMEFEPETPPIAENAISLSLERAIEIALRNNLDVVLQRFNRATARLSLLQALGAYDTRLEGTASAQDTVSPTLDPTRLTQFEQRRLLFEINQPLPNGGEVGVGLDNSRNVGASREGSFTSYDSGLTFSLFQPLLRNFGGNSQREQNLLVARTNSLISLQEFETQVTTTIRQVVDAYWDLAEANLQLQVAQESLSLAQELHNRNKIQVEVGTLPPLDLVQSEAAIAEREEAIILAQTNIGNAEDNLRLLLNLPTEGQYWALPIRTTTDPEGGRITIDVAEALRTAFAERADLRIRDLAIEQSQVQAAFARNQALPQLNLDVNYNLAGTGTGVGNAFEQVYGIDFDGWSAALFFSLPLQNRAAKAGRTLANLAVESAETQRELLESQITNEVRQAARGVDSAAKTIEAARVSRQFQERNLDAERKRYENGMSTSFQITQIQEDLTQARQREVTAIINYRRAVSDFYRATGRLLDEEGIELLDPAEELKRYQFSLFGR